jgi:hypothetical protein
MAYKTEEEPRKGDQVLGTINNEPASGKVLSVNTKKGTIVIVRRGKAQRDEKTKQMIQGQIEHVEASADDFELVYRKEA